MLGVQELVVILLIVVLVFGAKRIPEIMDSLGKGIKTFKRAMDEDDHPQPSQTPAKSVDISDTPSGPSTDKGEVSKQKNGLK